MAKANATAKANAKTGRTSAKKSATSKKATTSKKPETVKAAKAAETSKKPETTKTQETPKAAEKFESMCGFDYDAAEAGSCNTTCSEENPEAHAACVANFKATAKKSNPSGTKKARRGKNQWGHLIGCQGELIDQQFLTVGGAHSMDDIMKEAKATRPRVISHLKHLVSVWKVELRVTEDGKYFIEGLKSNGLVGKLSNGVKVIEVPETAAA